MKALYQEGLEIARAVGDQDLVARFLNNLAIQERRAGNLDTALRMNQESLSIRREIGDRTNAAISLNNIGNLLLDMGDPQAASAALPAVGSDKPRDRGSPERGARAAQCGIRPGRGGRVRRGRVPASRKG